MRLRISSTVCVFLTMLGSSTFANNLTEEEHTLLEASHTESIDLVQGTPNANPDINVSVRNCYKYKSLSHAALNGDFDAVKFFVRHDVNFGTPRELEHNYIHAAAQQNRMYIPAFLIEHGANVNAIGEGGDTPIHMTVEHHDLDTVMLFVYHGTNVNTPDSDGCTLLDRAVSLGHLDTVTLLLAHGSNLETNRLKKLLKIALNRQRFETSLLLLNHVYVPFEKVQRLFRWTPLHVAVYNGGFEAVRLCLETHPESINFADVTLSTPLHYAAYAGHEHLIQPLLDNGARRDQLNQDGQTPLNLAARYGHLNTVLLLASPENVNKVGNYQWTPLHYAAENGNVDIIKALIDIGAKINVFISFKESPLYLAALNGHCAAFNLLKSRGADMNALSSAYKPLLPRVILRKHREMAVLLINMSDSSTFIHHGRFLLHLAVLTEQDTTAELLMQKDVDINDRDWNGPALLRLAAAKGCCSVIKAFMASGIDVNAPDVNGQTLLHHAASNGHVKTVSTLQDLGANMTAQDKCGRTPFRLAARNGHVDVVIFYFTYGIGPTPRPSAEIEAAQQEVKLIVGSRTCTQQLVWVALCALEFSLSIQTTQEYMRWLTAAAYDV